MFRRRLIVGTDCGDKKWTCTLRTQQFNCMVRVPITVFGNADNQGIMIKRFFEVGTQTGRLIG